MQLLDVQRHGEWIVCYRDPRDGMRELYLDGCTQYGTSPDMAIRTIWARTIEEATWLSWHQAVSLAMFIAAGEDVYIRGVRR